MRRRKETSFAVITALLCCSTHKWQTYVHKEKHEFSTWTFLQSMSTMKTRLLLATEVPRLWYKDRLLQCYKAIFVHRCLTLQSDLFLLDTSVAPLCTSTTATCNTHLQGCRPSPRMMTSRGRDIIHARTDLFLPDAWAVPRKHCSVPPPPLLLRPAIHICKVAHQALGWCQVDNVISYPSGYELLQFSPRLISSRQCDIIPKWICTPAVQP